MTACPAKVSRIDPRGFGLNLGYAVLGCRLKDDEESGQTVSLVKQCLKGHGRGVLVLLDELDDTLGQHWLVRNSRRFFHGRSWCCCVGWSARQRLVDDGPQADGGLGGDVKLTPGQAEQEPFCFALEVYSLAEPVRTGKSHAGNGSVLFIVRSSRNATVLYVPSVCCIHC